VKTCIDTLGGPMMVGGDVAIWCSQQGREFTKVPADEMEAIANGVADWRGIERDSLDKVVIPSGAVETAEETIPMPEAIDVETEAPDAAADPTRVEAEAAVDPEPVGTEE